MTSYPSQPGVSVAVDLVTADRATAQRFYGPLLGWSFTEAENAVHCLAGGTVAASLVDAAYAPVPGWRTCFQGFPLDTTAGFVRASGGRLLDAPSADPAIVQVTDPLDVPFAITDAVVREPVPPGPGRAVWHENMTADASVADPFYRDVLGLATVVPGEETGASGAEYVLLVSTGRTVGGRLVVPAELSGVVPLGWMVYFADADPDDSAARAVALGGSVVVPPRDAPTGRVAALADPEGAVFALIRGLS